jgi:hypothetical protein
VASGASAAGKCSGGGGTAAALSSASRKAGTILCVGSEGLHGAARQARLLSTVGQLGEQLHSLSGAHAVLAHDAPLVAGQKNKARIRIDPHGPALRARAFCLLYSRSASAWASRYRRWYSRRASTWASRHLRKYSRWQGRQVDCRPSLVWGCRLKSSSGLEVWHMEQVFVVVFIGSVLIVGGSTGTKK